MTDHDDKPIQTDCGHYVASHDDLEEVPTPLGVNLFCADCAEHFRSEGRLP